MSTVGDESANCERRGAGGKFFRLPLWRSCPAKPYDRPHTALRGNNPGMLPKVVDTASRLIYATTHKIFGVSKNRLLPLPDINEEPQNVSQDAGQNNSTEVSDEGGSSASISAVTGILELEQMLKQKIFTRSETQHLTALLHSRTCDNIFVERDGAKPPLPLLRLEASTTSDSLDNFHAPVFTSTVYEEQVASPADAYQGSTIGTNSINATDLPKILVTSPRYPATLENLPDDLLLNIFARLLAKQLAQMRCVSKSWNALLSQSSSVKSHLHHSIHNKDRNLLVFYHNASSSDPKPFTALPCSSPHLELTNFIKLPPVIPKSGDASIVRVIGSVHGLICSSYNDSLFHIWNPSLSAVSTLPPHHIPSCGSYEIFFRFGFDPKTDDYKLVKVTGPRNENSNVFPYSVKEWLQVEVYSMRKGSWGFITQRFPSRVTRVYDYEDVCIYGLDGHLHWLGDFDEEGEQTTIVAFNLGSETFREIPLPDAILDYNGSNPTGVLGGKLCFISWVGVCEVRVMEEYGVAESWVKRHVFSQFMASDVDSIGFTSRNEFLIEDDDCRLVLYDPIADKATILEKYCRGKFGVGKIVEYVDSLVWVAPTV